MFSHLSTSAVLLETLRSLNPHYPTVDATTKAELAQAKMQILHADTVPPGADVERVFCDTSDHASYRHTDELFVLTCMNRVIASRYR